MATIRTKDDLRALSRRHGLVDAAVGDVGAMDRRGDGRSIARERVAASILSELGLAEDKIVEKFGYSPEAISKRPDSRGLPPPHPMLSSKRV